jgi:hypothetical protein
MDTFRNKAYYQRNMEGNCNNGNCSPSNCQPDFGNGKGKIQCTNCVLTALANCTNCDTTKQLQTNCNCACTYNCSQTNVQYDCNCDCNCFWSDDRLKNRKNNIENALDIVRRLDGFYYEGNDLAVSVGLGNSLDVGVSAQKIKEEFPIALGPNLNNTDLMQVRYERLIPLLLEAIKQLDNKLEQKGLE